MAIKSTLESAVVAQKSALMLNIGMAALGQGEAQARQVAEQMGQQALTAAREINTSVLPVDPARGRNLNIVV